VGLFWDLYVIVQRAVTNYHFILQHASNVLLAFKSFKLDDMQGKRQKLEISDGDKQHHQQQQHYFAKFLTNQKLLELQLSDANFRRYVLLQILIVFQYLNSPVKFKS
jgi:THO complex subunit 1